MESKNGDCNQVSEDRNKAPELLAEMAHHVSAVLKEMTDMGTDEADNIAFEVITRIAEQWGGCQFYFPKGVAMQYYRRYRQIYQDFTGSNHTDLAKRYHLSIQRIYKIIDIVRTEEIRRRQRDIFE